jgi:hypothetical protein
MSTRFIPALVLFTLCASAQIEPAVTGLLLHPDGRLVHLVGVPGAWVAQPSGCALDAAASSGRTHVLKSGRLLTVIDTDTGSAREYEAPAGDALFTFNREGKLLAVHYKRTAETLLFNPNPRRLRWKPARGESVIAIGPSAEGTLFAVVERENELAAVDTATLSYHPLPELKAPVLITPQGEIVSASDLGIPDIQRVDPLGADLHLLRTSAALYAWSPARGVLTIPSAESPALQVFPWGSDTPLPQPVITMPAAAPGEFSELRFRVRNTGASTLIVNRLFIDHPAKTFELFNEFSVPRTFPPGGFGDFWLRFSPSTLGPQKVDLWIGDLKFEVRGEGVGRPALEMESGGTWRLINPGSTVDLGRTEREMRLERWFRMNGAPQPPAVGGEGCAIDARGEQGEFRLAFSAAKAGTYLCVLLSDGRQYTFRIVVNEFAPPNFTLAAGIEKLESGRQEKVAIRFDTPARAAATGTLRLEFQPDRAALSDETAIAFLPSMSRSVSFSVKEGAQDADFSGEPNVSIQTGTTAGALTLRASIGDKLVTRTLRIEPAPVRLTSSRALAGGENAQVTLEGFDNVRSFSTLAFVFYLKNGQPAAPGRMEIDVKDAFSKFFAEAPRGGGTFRVQARFIVQGTISELESVEVEARNDQGATNTGRLRFN